MLKIDLIAQALVEYRKVEGVKKWRHKLYSDWDNGEYDYCHRDYEPFLQQCRNNFYDSIAHDIKDDATLDDIKLALRKEVLLGQLEDADAIVVNHGPLLTSWDFDNNVLAVSWSTEEMNVRYKIRLKEVEKIESEEGTKIWEVTVPSGTYSISCFMLSAMSVA